MSDKEHLLAEIKELHSNFEELKREFHRKFSALERRLNVLTHELNDECDEIVTAQRESMECEKMECFL
ncbi:MAG: hypothetical protein ACMUJM_14980 [bacterium]